MREWKTGNIRQVATKSRFKLKKIFSSDHDIFNTAVFEHSANKELKLKINAFASLFYIDF